MKKILFILFISFAFFSNSFAGCYTQRSYNEFMKQWTTQEVCDFGTNYLPSYTPTYFAPSFFDFPSYNFFWAPSTIDIVLPTYYEPVNYGFFEFVEADFGYGWEPAILWDNFFW